MTVDPDLRDEVRKKSDEALHDEAILIQENLAECGPRSSYAERNRPRLRAITYELRRRGLT